MVWTQHTIQLFNDIKQGLKYLPILTRFDPDKSLFLKTDWSGLGMVWIPVQPTNNTESLTTIELLQHTSECKFYLQLTGKRLQPLAFDSCACTGMESKLHSLMEEIASVRWGIG